MAYNKDKPADNDYLSEFPASEREQQRAIINDQIVDAGHLKGLVPGNADGNIPISNGNVNVNLNADTLDGKHSSFFSPDGHRHDNATTSSDGYLSKEDKGKLDTVATGAEVNQNAFANIKVGTVTLQADNKQDTLSMNAGRNISLTPDSDNDSITVGVTGTVDVAAKANALAKAINLSLSGKAVGNVATDGSSDANIEITEVHADDSKESDHAKEADHATKADTATNADLATKATTADVATKANGLSKPITIKIHGMTAGQGTLDGTTSIIDIKTTALPDQFNNIAVPASWTTSYEVGPLYGEKKRTISLNNGIAAGTYSLQNLLNLLVQRCHWHSVNVNNCVCKCNCNCHDNDEE